MQLLVIPHFTFLDICSPFQTTVSLRLFVKRLITHQPYNGFLFAYKTSTYKYFILDVPCLGASSFALIVNQHANVLICRSHSRRGRCGLAFAPREPVRLSGR